MADIDGQQLYVVTYPGDPYSEHLDDLDQVIERVSGVPGGRVEHVPLSRGLLLTCCGTGPQAEEVNNVARQALGRITHTPLPTFGVLALAADSGDGTPAPLTGELRRTVLEAVQAGVLITRYVGERSK